MHTYWLWSDEIGLHSELDVPPEGEYVAVGVALDLIAALKEIVPYLRGLGDRGGSLKAWQLYEAAQAAIDKATGEDRP